MEAPAVSGNILWGGRRASGGLLFCLQLTIAALLAGCSLSGSGSCDAGAAVPLVEVAVPPIAGRTASFDAMLVDQAGHRLYAADRTDASVDVFDVSGGRPAYVTSIAVGGAPNGLALAPDLGRLFAGVSDGTVAAIDLATGRATKIAGGRAAIDLLDFDPRDGRVFAASPEDGLLISIDAVSGTVRARIPLAAGLEQPRYSPEDGMVYVNDSARNQVFQVDAGREALAATHPLHNTCAPAGMAIDERRGRALLGCSARKPQQLVFWDLRQHRVSTVVASAGAGDLALYDPVVDRYLFAAEHWSAGPEIAILKGDGSYLTAVGLPAASPSVAFDEAHTMVYTGDQRPGHGGLFRFALPRC